MAAVKILGIPRQKFPHDGGYAVLAALEKDVYVVIHEDPGIDGTVALCNILPESFKKTGFILIIAEYGGLVDSSHHDVVQGAGDVESGLAGHGVIVLKKEGIVKLIDRSVSTSPVALY
jgi:hypothetical protein